MGLFGGIAGLMSGGRSGSGNGDPARALLGGGIMDIMRAASGGKGKKSSGDKPPVDNSHSHGSTERRNTAEAQRGNSEPVNIGSVSSLGGFIGKGQVDQFSNLTDTSSVDRGGRTTPRPDDSNSLDPVGIKTAMNPSMATPNMPPDIDGEGTMNALYS